MFAGDRGGEWRKELPRIPPLTLKGIVIFGYKNVNVLLVSAACWFYSCLLTVMVAVGWAGLQICFCVKHGVNQMHKKSFRGEKELVKNKAWCPQCIVWRGC